MAYRISHIYLYTILGTLFGSLFPICSTLIEVAVAGLPFTPVSFVEVQRSAPLLWIIDSVPIWLGFFASLAGRKQDRLAATLEALEQTNLRVDTTNAMLRATNEALTDRTGDLQTSNEKLSREIAERKAIQNRLAQAKDEADMASEAKGMFLANMSHEIRTPMNAIIGLTNLAMRNEIDGRTRDYLAKVLSSSYTLLGIINDILDCSKIEAGKIELEQIDFLLSDVLNHVGLLVGDTATERGIEFLTSIDPTAPRSLVGDPLRLGQVLTNLANNAVKFTHEGEVHIRVDCLDTTDEQAELRFSIRDTGIGIDPDAMGRLFDAFGQADISTTRKYGGSGLGLTITSHLVELMGGQLEVHSELGVGSTFFFEVPLARQSVEETWPRPPVTLNGLKVLIVDDNHLARQVLGEMVDSFSFDARTASSGEEALDLATKAAKRRHPFDLVLIDWNMPSIDGIETVRQLERNARGAFRVPKIVMVSAHGEAEVMEKAKQAGIDAFVQKPVSPALLFNTIMDVFSHENLKLDRAAEVGEVEVARKLRGARVLVAEDNEINQQVAREVLQGAGLQVVIVQNGREAIQAALEQSFDVVLMDLQMPEADGFEATAAIRKERTATDLPIIAVTADAMKSTLERCLAVGMNDSITKPISTVALFKTLAKWIQQ